MEKPHMKWAIIKARLLDKGYTLARLAERLECTPQSISDVRSRPNSHIQQVIAEILETTEAALWPERFSSDGLVRLSSTRPQYRRPKDTAALAPHNI